jgi:hypothetical protein
MGNSPSKITWQSPDIETGRCPPDIGSNGNPSPGYYSPLDCKGAECNSVNCALHPLAMHSVWQPPEKEEETEPWEIPGKVDIELFLGSGQLDTPFTMGHKAFASRCAKFSTGFLRELRGKQPLYECKIQSQGNRPTVLELAMAVYETDAIFILVRYDIVAQVLTGLIFFKQFDGLSTCTLTLNSIVSFLNERRDEIQVAPLILLPTLLSFLQFRSHTPIRWRVSLLNAEARLGVTRRRDFLDLKGYPAAIDDFAFLNAHLSSLAHELDDTAAATKSIRLLHAQVGRVVRICEGFERCPSMAELAAECKEVYAQLFDLQVGMSRGNGQTLQGALYNKIGVAENQRMKVIAVISLMFLPTTLVAGVFGAGIISVQGAHSGSGSGQVVSKLWPLFLLLCVGLTVLVFGLWIAWERHGNRWLRKLGRMDVQGRWQTQQPVGYVPFEKKLREKQLSESQESLAQLERDGRQRSNCSDGYYCLEHNKEYTFRTTCLRVNVPNYE